MKNLRTTAHILSTKNEYNFTLMINKNKHRKKTHF